jgi:hypothetical protein
MTKALPLLQSERSPHGLAVRTPAFHAGDRRFESGWGYSHEVPVNTHICGACFRALLTLLAERRGPNAAGRLTVLSSSTRRTPLTCLQALAGRPPVRAEVRAGGSGRHGADRSAAGGLF